MYQDIMSLLALGGIIIKKPFKKLAASIVYRKVVSSVIIQPNVLNFIKHSRNSNISEQNDSISVFCHKSCLKERLRKMDIAKRH